MPVVRVVPSAPRRLLAGLVSLVVLGVVIDHAGAQPLAELAGGSPAPFVETAGHLVVSEVMTGGASASDEFIELYNPTTEVLPLEGLEVVYVTASGATVTRKAAWSAGAAGVAAGAHHLIANGAGIYAGVADVTYANGLAATGGSVALRVIGASSAIDAVGWGNAASTWLELRPAPAPPAGSSLERLPGGAGGSGQDTDDNLIDFAVQALPDPQNSGSVPVPAASGSAVPSVSPTVTETPAQSDSATPEPSAPASGSESPALTPTPAPTASGSPTPTPSPTGTPSPNVISIAEARSQPDGAPVTVEGVTLTAGDFADGGGYLADGTAGIAVLVADGSFGRGEAVRVTGIVDDRYAQRTIRTTAAGIVHLGAGPEPLPLDAATGAIGESVEGRLVEVVAVISSSATTLSTGVAWDVDDGSGAARVLVGSGTGIDTSGWARGVGLTLVGVVGQRDSSGTGLSGYRIQPRDAADLLAVVPAATPTPSPSPSPTAQPSASGSGSPSASSSAEPPSPLVSIAEARAAATGTRLRVRGVVTAPSGLIESGSAVIQDATAGILVRIGTDVGVLALGQLVELDGTRSTKAGMLSLRVSTAPRVLGTQADPEAARRATGGLGESDEARVVIVRGAISGAISRPRGGSVSFGVDDGSGPIRVSISARASIPTASLAAGSWIELRAVLAQETTGSAPTSGYRLWPRVAADLRLIAGAVTGSATAARCCTSTAAPDRSAGAKLPRAVQGTGQGSQPQGIVPLVARPQPTSSPRGTMVVMADQATARDGAAAGGLVVSGMGLVALAGLAAWSGRRGRPDDEPPRDEAAPRLSVLRAERADARKERRILPPT